ncbi:hypothetical protein O181_125918, partial [Austropuccinia psidii MF-1]|nr:hypothetical protein [Austropuccinia psidii MF-1]
GMEETFMGKFCQIQWLGVFQNQKSDSCNKPLSKKEETNSQTYGSLLQYLQKENPDSRSFSMIPHPANSSVLQSFATNMKSVAWL